MPRRNRAVTLMLMPMAVFLWCLGWSLYWSGSRKNAMSQPKLSRDEDLTFIVPVPEQKVAA